MTSSSVTVNVEMVLIEHGIWCDTCLLSTGVRAWFTTTVGNQTTLGSKTACEEH